MKTRTDCTSIDLMFLPFVAYHLENKHYIILYYYYYYYGSFPASFLGRSSYTDSDFTVAKMAPASGGQGLKIKKIRNYE